MTTYDELLDLERRSWEALSTEGAASSFYDKVLARDVLIVMPGGMVIDDRQQVVDSMGGTPWSSFELSEVRVLELGDGGAALVYKVKADREGTAYQALLNSTYIREDGEWRLALHQQTPF